ENSDNFSYDETIENNNTTSIVKKIQAAANKCYSNNNMLEDSDNKSLFAHYKLIENDSFAKKLLNAANIFYHKSDSNQFPKETPTLLTFWSQNKTSEEADKYF
ncbi:22580_t:CDS:2, partial [Gigaspora rosea]